MLAVCMYVKQFQLYWTDIEGESAKRRQLEDGNIGTADLGDGVIL
jgi:hypothetical protein